MSDPEKIDYLSNYKTDHLYIHPTANGNGSYVTLVFEADISKQVKLALKAFYVTNKQDFNNFSLVKMKLVNDQWVSDQEVSISNFNLSIMRDFLNILNGLDLKESKRQRISLNQDIDVPSIISLLQTENGKKTLECITNDATFKDDIIALAHKKNELNTFNKLLNQFEEFRENYTIENMLTNYGEENIWQHFFENNKWIFGYALNYIFLDKVNKKLETSTTGQTFEHSGKRVDALMRTKAEVSQTVFIELKKPSEPLVNQKEYRSGCWTVSQPIYEAIGQVQKTVFDFLKNRSSRFEWLC